MDCSVDGGSSSSGLASWAVAGLCTGSLVSQGTACWEAAGLLCLLGSAAMELCSTSSAETSCGAGCSGPCIQHARDPAGAKHFGQDSTLPSMAWCRGCRPHLSDLATSLAGMGHPQQPRWPPAGSAGVQREGESGPARPTGCQDGLSSWSSTCLTAALVSSTGIPGARCTAQRPPGAQLPPQAGEAGNGPGSELLAGLP